MFRQDLKLFRLLLLLLLLVYQEVRMIPQVYNYKAVIEITEFQLKPNFYYYYYYYYYFY